MGQPNELKKLSEHTGKPIDALIDEALASSTTRTEVAAKLGISTQALSMHLARRKREAQPVAGK
jgi:predicted ArsR family transcriptional regulator